MPDEVRTLLYKSGRWEIDLAQRELRFGGSVVPLGARAFEVLGLLAQAAGELVSKNDLIDRVWPGTTVAENTLHVHISAIRRALGADRDILRNVSGRGYRLLGAWVVQAEGAQHNATNPNSTAYPDDWPQMAAEIPEPGRSSSRPTTNLPAALSELIGRDADLLEILNVSTTRRLVTLTGSGGIGKTRLAFEAARHQLPGFADGVWVAELASLSDADLVPVTVATALGLELASGTASPQSVANALGARHLLLVLDNCEHVIDAAAQMVELLLRTNPMLHVIATSREPLQIEGEWVYRVPPLAVPPEDGPETEDPLRWGAVRLFAERARAAGTKVPPDIRTATSIVGICRHLDGIPLAIELAAACVASLGIAGVAFGLGDRFKILATASRRTAPPRHQTLRGTLDWSYGLLTEPERVVLRRLAIFAGGFTPRAAVAVVADDALSAIECVQCTANLVTKSLVVIEAGDAVSRHRLLETTRAYALQHLAQAGEADVVARRHARHYLQIVLKTVEKWQTAPIQTGSADHGLEIDNVRAALDWAFSPTGDAAIALALTAATVPVWMHLSLMEECRRRAVHALAILGTGVVRNKRCEMQLYVALAASLSYTKGAVAEVGAAWAKALEIAEGMGDAAFQLRALWGLWAFNTLRGQHCAALTLAQKCHTLAATRGDLIDQRICERMIGTSRYYLGDLIGARHHVQRALAHCAAPARRRQILRFEGDERVRAQAYAARILWLQGFPDQAMRAVEGSLAEAWALNRIVAWGDALVSAACAIALWVGNLSAAEHYVETLLDYSKRHDMARWQVFGQFYQGLLAIQRGQTSEGLRMLRAAYESDLGRPIARFFLFRMAEALGCAGEIAEGLGMIEQAIIGSELREERWATAEILRIKGELLLLQGAAGAAAAAEVHFRQAINRARQQGALSWELRAATSLARMWRKEMQNEAARNLLVPIYERFGEGFATADLKAAKSLIDGISSVEAATDRVAPF